jgi:hypothetical protein
MCMYRIHIRMYTARTCTCMHTCTHTFIPWSARVRSFLRASSSACALALLFVASCAQSPLCVCVRVCLCVTVCVCVCVWGVHREFLRAGMHAPPASCQRELTLSTKSRQREEALDGLKHGFWTLECVFRGNVGIHRAHGSQTNFG